VIEAQQKDVEVNKIKTKMESGIKTPFWILADGMVVIDRRIILPEKNALKIEVLKEAHESKFVVHPGNTKMYRDLKEFYWSSNIKKKKWLSIWPSVLYVNK